MSGNPLCWAQMGPVWEETIVHQAEPIRGVHHKNILKGEHKMSEDLGGSEDFSLPGLQLQMQGCNS